MPHRPKDIGPGFASVAVLFSGGIDCTVLAYLAHQHLPLSEPIDLLNVAFENPRTLRAAFKPLKKSKKARTTAEVEKEDEPEQGRATYDVPDRVTGRDEVEELRGCCAERTWNFVEIDIPYEDPSSAPAESPLPTPVKHESSSAAWAQTNSWVDTLGTAKPFPGLVDELQLDLIRLPSRNLGRDDRAISSNGKGTRYPFLSLSVVAFLASLPVEVKVNPTVEEGRGDKMLLRMLAERMGLVLASRRKKRAMQFGSRSARMEGGVADRKGDAVL
ncbi:hypothetical protein FRB90_004662 [Tulasnella sp. 427]|nr:hypothetical protein FRB90_004662 [Tulasnella sp. 427]